MRKKQYFKKGGFNKKQKPRHQSHLEELEGKILITMRGNGFVRTNSRSSDIEIAKNNLNTALNNDLVKISYDPIKRAGKVLQIIKRAKTEFVGTMEKYKGTHYFTPDDKKIYRDIIIKKQDKKISRIKNQEKILIKINEWNDPKKNPTGEIIKIIGPKGEHETEIKAILYEKGFSPSFPLPVEKEAEKIKAGAKIDFETETKKRKQRPDGPPSGWDFRQTTTFTIDPIDAKDFDDALSFKKLPDGNFEIGIHIADVSHYVTENSLIDKEAIKRGTSVYLVDRTIPMLPEILSNDLCSLNPNEDKLSYSVIVVLNPQKAEVINYWIGETVINSNKRFSYEEAHAILQNKKGEYFEELNILNELALKLRQKRIENGSINLGGEEVKFELDAQGFPVAIHPKKMFETNELIEDFMLLANKIVAEYIGKSKKPDRPFVYRIHDQPKQENMNELIIYLKKIGYKIPQQINSKNLNDLIAKIKGTEKEGLIEKAILKSMAKAIYSTKNIGHYGLAFEHYTHFTSPIRRYPDMLVHRLMKKYLNNQNVPVEDLNKYEELSFSSSQQESAAVDAERDSEKYKYAEYMSQKIGEEFNGIITGIAEWGVYVQDTETKAEGLVSVRTLKDDHYNIDPKNYCLTGESTNRMLTLGDKVKIKLLKVDLERRILDFEIIT